LGDQWSVAVSSQTSSTTCLSASGELDAYTAPDLGQRIAAAETPTVELDLSAVTFLDSSGLAALIEAHQRLTRDSRRLVVVDPSPVVARVLAVSGVTDHLHLQARSG